MKAYPVRSAVNANVSIAKVYLFDFHSHTLCIKGRFNGIINQPNLAARVGVLHIYLARDKRRAKVHWTNPPAIMYSIFRVVRWAS